MKTGAQKSVFDLCSKLTVYTNVEPQNFTPWLSMDKLFSLFCNLKMIHSKDSATALHSPTHYDTYRPTPA